MLLSQSILKLAGNSKSLVGGVMHTCIPCLDTDKGMLFKYFHLQSLNWPYKGMLCKYFHLQSDKCLVYPFEQICTHYFSLSASCSTSLQVADYGQSSLPYPLPISKHGWPAIYYGRVKDVVKMVEKFKRGCQQAVNSPGENVRLALFFLTFIHFYKTNTYSVCTIQTLNRNRLVPYLLKIFPYCGFSGIILNWSNKLQWGNKQL